MVDTDDGGPVTEREFEISLVEHLDQGVHPEGLRRVQEDVQSVANATHDK